jgi:hypothetical protein
MPSIAEIFSSEDLKYLIEHPESIAVKARLPLNSALSLKFTVPLTESIRETLARKLGLTINNIVTELPMRWIQGDTAAHIDSGASNFKTTYLVYLNDSEGQFIIENTSYSITANSGFVFSEGLTHKTEATGTLPRLLLGPMNEFAEPVGATVNIKYYDNLNGALSNNSVGLLATSSDYIIGASLTGSIAPYTAWRLASSSTGTSSQNVVYRNGDTLIGDGFYFLYSILPCFKEGTKILCKIDGIETYAPIENLKPGDLVKTSRNGYKKIEIIGSGIIQNPANDERIENRLYKCSPEKYPQLKDDLYITGCHSILVDSLTGLEREKLIKQLGKIFVTDEKYRLTAYADERAQPWSVEGEYKIWHLALENENIKMNYGIYANGLLVETASINFLRTKSNMDFSK